MDNLSISAESQQYEQYYHQYQEATASHAYDPSIQAYYASYHHYNQTPQQQQEARHDYSYYYPDYSNSYQSHPQPEPSSIHPPGVPIPGETRQTHFQNHPNVYYSHGFANPQQQQPQNGYMAPGHSTFAGRGSHGGRPIRGGRKGGRLGSSRGRGRGGARGTASANQAAARIPGQVPQPPSSSLRQAAVPPPRMAWCEICKVDCNTAEILEQHKNGKKHKRNLKVYEELQSLIKVPAVMQNPQTQGPDSKPEAVQPEKKEGGLEEKQPMIAEAVVGDSSGGVDNPVSSGARTSEETKDHSGGARGGFKRKMKGGRGGKWMRSNDGSRKPVEPPKPKQVAPLFCELCNVKCESQVVFDSHMAGKKHLANVKRFQGHQATLGGGVQALYLPVPNAPSTSLPSQANQQRLPEAQVLASALANQQGGLQDPQASQAALVQLLNQHGIHDAQTLLVQLIPFLLTQVLPNGAAPGPSTQPGAPASGIPGVTTGPVIEDQPNSRTQLSTGDTHNSETAVDGISAQNTETRNVEAESSKGTIDKPNTGSSELQGKVVEPPTTENTVSTEQADAAGKEQASVAGSNDNCDLDKTVAES